MKVEHGREHGTGRYTWTTDRLCVCGHRLGEHTAARVKDPKTGIIGQPCMSEEPEEPCGCELFAPAKRRAQ